MSQTAHPVEHTSVGADVGIAPEQLKELFREHPSGVAVVTADSQEGPIAMTISSLFSVSVAPPLVVFSASALSSSTPALLAAESIVVHLIDSASVDIAVTAATSGIDRFADRSTWSRLESGEPYFHAASHRFRGKIVSRMDAGASTLLLVQVMESWVEPDASAAPLVYHARSWHSLSEASRLTLP